MEKMDYYYVKTAEDEKVVVDLQAAGHNIYGGLVTCLRPADFRGIVGIPRFQHPNINNMVRMGGYFEFVKCMMQMNEEKYGPVPRVFTQIGWFVRLFDKYQRYKETYRRQGLKQQLITEALDQVC